MVNNYLDLALSIFRDSIPATVKDHYELLEHYTCECNSCGAHVRFRPRPIF